MVLYISHVIRRLAGVHIYLLKNNQERGRQGVVFAAVVADSLLRPKLSVG